MTAQFDWKDFWTVGMLYVGYPFIGMLFLAASWLASDVALASLSSDDIIQMVITISVAVMDVFAIVSLIVVEVWTAKRRDEWHENDQRIAMWCTVIFVSILGANLITYLLYAADP